MSKKIFTTARVKNESDIIESFIRYNLTYCDGMLINDNGSIDNTTEIIQKLIDEGLSLHWVGTGNKTKMALIAVEEYGADLVVALDADEFLYHIDGINPRETLESFDETVEYQAIWRTYIYKDEPDIELGFMPNNFIGYRNPIMESPDRYERHKKTIVSKYLLTEKAATYGVGGHFLLYSDKNRRQEETKILDSLVFAHFPVRSKLQVMLKTITDWIHKCKTFRPDDINLAALQTGFFYNKIREHGEITIEEVKQHSFMYAMFMDSNINGEGKIYKPDEIDKLVCSIKDEIIKYELMNLAFCADKLTLKYTEYSDNNNVLLRAITREIYSSLLHIHTDRDDKNTILQSVINQFNTLEQRCYVLEKECRVTSLENITPGLFSRFTRDIYSKNFKITDWLKKRSIKSVAIYGIGLVGRWLLQDLLPDKEIEVFLLDTYIAGQYYLSQYIYTAENFDRAVDAVMITATKDKYIDEIKAVLGECNINYKHIITLYDFLYTDDAIFNEKRNIPK